MKDSLHALLECYCSNASLGTMGQSSFEKLLFLLLNKNQQPWAADIAQLVERLFSMYEVLDLLLNTTENQVWWFNSCLQLEHLGRGVRDYP